MRSIRSVSLGASLVATAVASTALAQSPAPAPAPAGSAGALPADGGAAPPATTTDPATEPPVDETPPEDIEGASEDPEAAGAGEKIAPVVKVKAEAKTYPIEEVARPITLHKGMSEVGLDFNINASPFASSGMLRARYAVTDQVQLGLRYNFGGLYDDPETGEFVYNLGKAAGLDVTYQIKPFVGVSVGVPVYFDPVATSLQIGVPLRFRLGDKLVFGGLNDVMEFRLAKFIPSYTSELQNEVASNAFNTNTTSIDSLLRVSGYTYYQHKPNMAFFGKLGITSVEFSSLDLQYSLKGGVQVSPKRYLDLGAGIGFDDLSLPGDTFGINLYAAFRI